MLDKETRQQMLERMEERQKRAAEREERKVKALERIADVLEQLWDWRRPSVSVEDVPVVREGQRID